MGDPQEDHSMETEDESQSTTSMPQSSAVGPPNETYHPQRVQVLNSNISTQSEESLPMEVEESVDEDIDNSVPDIQPTANTAGFTTKPSAKDFQEKPTLLKQPVLDTLENDMQHPQPSTSSDAQDVAEVLVQIVWKVEKTSPIIGKEKQSLEKSKIKSNQKSKLENMLEMGLQSMVSKKFEIAVSVQNLVLETPNTAKIKITPSKALDTLLNMNTAQLKLKDGSEADVYFKQHESPMQKTQEIPRIPMTVSVEIDVLKYEHELGKSLLDKFAQYTSGHIITVKGTFEEVDRFYQQFHQVVLSSVAMNVNTVSEHTNPEQIKTSEESMKVPLFQYWYLNHMHRKDIENIEERHGVKIEAGVCVSVKANGPNSKSVTDASQEFEDLFRTCAFDIASVPVSSVIQSVKDIQSLDAKLMLSGSAQNWSLVGPRVEVAQAQKMQKEELSNDAERPGGEFWDKAERQSSHKESRWECPKTIEMNIKDPLLDNGISISTGYWEIMTKALQKQIKDIKNKYGVDLHEKSTQSDVNVTARSTGNQFVNLEVNAMRALMSLYQKVVMTTMSCSLQNPAHNQAENVKECLGELRKQNPSLVVVEVTATDGISMMIGLPDHLRFAVREIEMKLGGPVFDKEHKDMMGYDRDVEFMRPFTDGPSWEGSKLNEGGWGKGAASGGVDNESINPSKAYWGFEMGAGGTSVVGEASSSFYAQDGHKTGGAGRKETNGFGNDKRGDTEAGVKGGSHDDRTAQPVGAESDGAKEEDKCPICMDEFTNKEKLACGHGFCKDCLRQCVESMGKKCPVCTKVYGRIEGDQPDGTMRDYTMKSTLPGFSRCGTIIIEYNIPSGIQSNKHPKPGRPFRGAQRTAYLPDNKEGREVLDLLRRAFNQKLIFTVGTSRTMGTDDCVTWNDVHHKTSTSGGAQSFGYPDDTYLQRVKEELKAKGIE